MLKRALAAALPVIFILPCGRGIASQSTPPDTPAPVPVLLDTDMDSDCDDAGALGMLHALADRGEAEILACGISAGNPWSAPCTDAINTYYARLDLPLGVPHVPVANVPSRYARQIAQGFPHDTRPGEPLPDAARLYRDLLMRRPDRSVVLLTVGDLTNVASLLKLPPEGDRPAGMEVARRKVKEWVCMGGNFIGRPARDDLKLGNNNFTGDKAGSLYAVRNWPAPVMFVGREIGSVPSGLKAGARLAEVPESNPVRMAYQHYFGGKIQDRHVADQTAVLYAVRGLRDYWTAETRGSMDLQPDMTFHWRYDTDRGHGFLLKRNGADGRPNDREIERVVEDLMLQPPRRKPAAPD